jgi:hypothetical protein
MKTIQVLYFCGGKNIDLLIDLLPLWVKKGKCSKIKCFTFAEKKHLLAYQILCFTFFHSLLPCSCTSTHNFCVIIYHLHHNFCFILYHFHHNFYFILYHFHHDFYFTLYHFHHDLCFILYHFISFLTQSCFFQDIKYEYPKL